jgi:streptogramin lyase
LSLHPLKTAIHLLFCAVGGVELVATGVFSNIVKNKCNHLKNKIPYCLLFSFLLFGRLFATAQKVEVVYLDSSQNKIKPYLRFNKTTIDNEAYKNAISKGVTLHDKQGYLWLLGDSDTNRQLIRYDGNYSKAFHNLNWVLFESKNGDIVGTNDNGFAVFDSRSESFRQYRNPFVKYKDPKMEHKLLWWQTMGNGNDLWFLQQHDEDSYKWPSSPFFRFDCVKLQFTKFLPKYVKNTYSNKLENFKGFLPLITTPNGRVWGMVHTTKAPHSLAYFDPATRQCVSFPIDNIDTPESNIDPGNQSTFIFLKNIVFDGRYLWMGHTWAQVGLLRFDTQTYQWKQFMFPNAAKNRISNIVIKSKDELWLMNSEAYLTVFNKNTLAHYQHKREASNPFAPSMNEHTFYADKKAMLWFNKSDAANQNELTFLDSSKQYFRQNTLLPEKANGFRSLLKNDNKHLYLYHKDNAMRIWECDETTQTNKELWRYVDKKGLYIDMVGALDDTISHKLWLFGITDTGGLFEIDRKKGTVVPVKAKISGFGKTRTDSIKVIKAYCQDRSGDVWFADLGRLVRFNHVTKAFEGFKINVVNENEEIWSMMTDSKGVIWIGYRTGWLVWFDPSTQKATLQKVFRSHPDGGFRKIVEDKARKVVWLSKSDMGLWKYDVQKRTYSKVPAISSLYSMQLTKNGMMWIGTSENLIRYNPNNGDMQKFGGEYGLSNFDWTSLGKTSDDEFFFGKFRFKDEDVKTDTTRPNVVYSFVKVFGKMLPLPQSLNYTNALELNFDQNFFEIGFSILTYFQKEKNQYAYQLVNFNKDWVNVGNKPLATFTNVPPGEYTLKIKGANADGIWSAERLLQITIHPAFWQTWWFRLLTLGLFLGSVYLIYRYQLDKKALTERLKSAESLRKQLEAEYKQKIAQTEITALRAQMNPHFIFNCLNSIQLFTAQNNTEKASDYLTKFSRLIRLVLENSRSEKVTLENEIETLRLYIELEAMRFRDKFTYNISIAKTIDQSYIQIPPLLLQPFVENAIWHGLMHKEEGGKIDILINQPKENLLHIEISDDGIGREKALEYKSKSATQNKSFGLKVTSERIELINQLYNTHTKVQIIDLKNADGQAIGTKVIINIPIAI